ncbi:hypothetical protein LH431_08780 [Laribacter hongkongensis]|uniref:hypothetical protein n=1 Tax=Laribacter hongkongensis TaxID=168471 RepID=UPI001EFEBDE5|nr:hypothetical protein [Laribacter hongkongensis]MCG9010704.1 hypothetical protein [Laribacter hongkongensis]MCG9048167.1 hypothetical protein [Laribacter hongkongensis]
MRNNRQHKKISKQAMDLLISHYGYGRDSFTLESEMGGKYKEEWHFWTAPCYWYGERDQMPAIGLLFDEVLGERTDWTEAGPVFLGPPIPDRDVDLIRFVKAKIKAEQEGGAA